ncbi:ribosome small subunit-dependent GTPase A [Marinomonas mediterranea]|jgi:Predicted GTPases|uniref:Small ribosomal subunit biogenesis GTPase RsgA n=1 Tax=Marinomonas mediterranea (strain ATCC 700492 / JCM 21426 / NBRC 103028 / MMB-1) TaxID=717774 RepID=F2JW53_MARM1|nr:ribosome small subunit-dependent GTPase A [Marinomonas mediterranea]ADZ89441.1 ribosome biogenesis GTPase RsgA [Marinomonas mediterranea MMB-1]WCN15694.1 ribosome small subunit-dependent GTPase A [Marinomonas mediterranea MMB-1]
MTKIYSLSQLGWTPFFQQQLSLEELSYCIPARLAGQHRGHLDFYSDQGKQRVLTSSLHSSDIPSLTVGDWVLLRDGRIDRVLERVSLFSRRAAGEKVSEQYICANVDTVFITTSLNNDFSLNRIERYLAMVKDAGAQPTVVLTKADLCTDVDACVSQVQSLDPLLIVEAVNALDVGSLAFLKSGCSAGNTVAVMGSSGVGKSTLINGLLGESVQNTASIRDDDDKGRHTTVSRTLHMIPNGGVLLDTPGMRELQLSDCESGVNEAFADVHSLAGQCRFSDCSHQSEKGCAVQNALAQGSLDERRLANYLKLLREQERNGATLAEKRARDRSLSRHYRSSQSEAQRFKRGE